MKEKKPKLLEATPVTFAQANFTYTAPEGMKDCRDLPCFRTTNPPCAISLWIFPWRDRIRFLLTGKMWFYMLGSSHPPITMMTKSPFPPVTNILPGDKH